MRVKKIYGLSREQFVRASETIRRSERNHLQQHFLTSYYGRGDVGGRSNSTWVVKVKNDVPVGGPSSGLNLYECALYNFDAETGGLEETTVATVDAYCFPLNNVAPTYDALHIGVLIGHTRIDGVTTQRPVFAIGNALGDSDELVPITVVTDVCWDPDCEFGGGSSHPAVTIADGLDYASIDEETQVITLKQIDPTTDIDFTLLTGGYPSPLNQTDLIMVMDASDDNQPYFLTIDQLQFAQGWEPDTAPLLSGRVWIGNASNEATATAISGDATLSNTGVITLANSGVTAASYGASNSYTNFTVDAKGRLTAASTVALPTATSGYVSATTTSITADDTWTAVTSCQFTVPSTGTYLVTAVVRWAGTCDAGRFMTSRLRNSTDGTTLTASTTWLMRVNTAGTLMEGTTTITWIGSLTASKTIRLEAFRASGGTWTVSQITNDANGFTTISYVKLSS